MRIFASCLLLVLLAHVPLDAAAQPALPDVVRTRDGALYRGTIVENVPNDHVVILSPTGETHRFAMSDVAFAGPAQVVDEALPPPVALGESGTTSGAAPAVPPPVPVAPATPVRDGEVRLHVTSEEYGLTLMEQTGGAAVHTTHGSGVVIGFSRLCMAPCDLALPRGNYTFFLENQRGRAYRVPQPVMIEGDGELQLSLVSRRKQRIVRWVTSLVLSGAGAVTLVAGLPGRGCDLYYCHADPLLLALGSSMLGAGSGLMFAAIFTFDRGHVQFVPASYEPR